MQVALEQYYDDFGTYPSTCSDGATTCVSTSASWRGGATGCYGGYGYGASGFIPGLVSNYIPQLPADPRPSGSGCYLYRSNGTDYMALVHVTIETFDPDGPSGTGPFHPLDRPGANQNSIAVFSPGARGW